MGKQVITVVFSTQSTYTQPHARLVSISSGNKSAFVVVGRVNARQRPRHFQKTPQRLHISVYGSASADGIL